MSALTIILTALQNVLPSFAKSDGSIEAKIIDVVGTYADSEAVERRNSVNVINNALATQKITTVEYYRRKAVAFQYGDTLIYDPINQGGAYEKEDHEKRIIKQSYVVGSYPLYTMLVNAIGGDGHLRPLTAIELASFDTYFQAFQPLGLELNVNSMKVAEITDPNILIYIRQGADAGAVIDVVQANLLAYEAMLRTYNGVSLTEIEDVIQQCPEVNAVSFSDPVATEQGLDGVMRETRPINGIFELTNGAFTFATEITTDNIKTLR